MAISVPGEYVLEAQAMGFRTERRVGVIIQINQQARIDFRMQVGDVQQAVDVTAAAPCYRPRTQPSVRS